MASKMDVPHIMKRGPEFVVLNETSRHRNGTMRVTGLDLERGLVSGWGLGYDENTGWQWFMRGRADAPGDEGHVRVLETWQPL